MGLYIFLDGKKQRRATGCAGAQWSGSSALTTAAWVLCLVREPVLQASCEDGSKDSAIDHLMSIDCVRFNMRVSSLPGGGGGQKQECHLWSLLLAHAT